MVYMLELSGFVGSEKHKAKYYIGYTDNVRNRLQEHVSGEGSKMIRHALMNLGMKVRLVGVIEGDRKYERKLKNRKNNNRLVKLFKNEEENSYYGFGDVLH